MNMQQVIDDLEQRNKVAKSYPSHKHHFGNYSDLLDLLFQKLNDWQFILENDGFGNEYSLQKVAVAESEYEGTKSVIDELENPQPVIYYLISASGRGKGTAPVICDHDIDDTEMMKRHYADELANSRGM